MDGLVVAAPPLAVLDGLDEGPHLPNRRKRALCVPDDRRRCRRKLLPQADSTLPMKFWLYTFKSQARLHSIVLLHGIVTLTAVMRRANASDGLLEDCDLLAVRRGQD